MKGNSFKLAIVGSGPAGLSAAARAAELGVSHVLLEAEAHLSNTIHRYQRGKHVMSEPKTLPLRAALPFSAGRRENILGEWERGTAGHGVNVRLNSGVSGITGTRGNFVLTLVDGSMIEAEFVVLAIGVQGNLNQLTCPGASHPRVQYQLDDPDEYAEETIIVIGVGNAGLENALALAANNQVLIINQHDDFRYANDANEAAIRAAMRDGSVVCHYNAEILRVETEARFGIPSSEESKPVLVLKVDQNEVRLPCDRIIARIGAQPPRKFVEACGVRFASPDRASLPELSESFESSVSGLYIVGALAGFPLIKQAMNQGYEVVETIEGRKVESADTPLLRNCFKPVRGLEDVESALDIIAHRIPLLAALSRLQLREFMIDSKMHTPRPGQTLFARNDYGDSFFLILDGEVEGESRTGMSVRLGGGDFFGEIALISGRRRNATMKAGKNCVLIETPRRTMFRILQVVPSVKQQIESAFLHRTVKTIVGPTLPAGALVELVATAKMHRYKSGELVFKEGDPADGLHLIAKGSITISRLLGSRETVLSYVPAGNHVGGLSLLSNTARTVTARAAAPTETIHLDGVAFKALLDAYPTVRERLAEVYQARAAENHGAAHAADRGGLVEFLMAQGIGEATDVLLIDESLCVRCDQCEKACADTHGGVSRLNREAGPTFEKLHVPTSCRHCEHPHCMKDCPPDAIKRNSKGEVYITDACIGCGNCERNCPYGVIHMGEERVKQPSLWRWMLFGGDEPGRPASQKPKDRSGSKAGSEGVKKAVKCDMCMDNPGGAACVRACPTGAALRVSPEQFMRVAGRP